MQKVEPSYATVGEGQDPPLRKNSPLPFGAAGMVSAQSVVTGRVREVTILSQAGALYLRALPAYSAEIR